MNILTINSGSSSIKFQLITMPEEYIIASGIVERIGYEDAKVKFKSDGRTNEYIKAIKSHNEGLKNITELLLGDHGPIDSPDDITAVGHRVVHGGNTFSETCIIDEEVRNKIEEYSILAPLHNPHNLKGIMVTEEIFSNAFRPPTAVI